MTIHVTTTQDLSRSFPNATSWHVDDTGQLHVTKTGSGNVATFHPGAWNSVERVTETSADGEPAAKGVRFKVRCPVCNEMLEYQHEEAEAWGILSFDDHATAEVTTHDKGLISAHMKPHHEDGTWKATWEARIKSQADRAERYFATK